MFSHWYESRVAVRSDEAGRDHHSSQRATQEDGSDRRRAVVLGGHPRPAINPNVTIPRDPCADSTGHHRTERPENVDPPSDDLGGYSRLSVLHSTYLPRGV